MGVLQVLRARLQFDLWMVTRTVGDDWIVLAAEDHGYNVRDGDIFAWSDSFCYRMTQGLGPNIAVNSDKIPAYACAPIGDQVRIGAYIGIPLVHSDGSLYGTLCAIHPTPLPASIESEFEFIKSQARLLSTLLSAEYQKDAVASELELEKRNSKIDELTGVYNRRGWNDFLRVEEERCIRYESTAAIVIIDLDDLKKINDTHGHHEGDHLLKNTANCLKSIVRSFDLICRIGGDEFAILVVETSEEATNHLVERIDNRLRLENIAASVGWAIRNGGNSLAEVMVLADQNMYAVKSVKKQQ